MRPGTPTLAFSLIQYSVSWPHTEAPSGTVRVRPDSPIWHFHSPPTAFRGPIWGLHQDPQWDRLYASQKPTLAISPTQYSVSWPHNWGAPPKPRVGPFACVPEHPLFGIFTHP
eukprot:9491401-Pyramimonas_sp.AAC.1